MTILHVDSSIHQEESVSRALSASTVSHLQEIYPRSQVVRRDLVAQPIPHFELATGQMSEIVDEFQKAETVVIGAPMYYFGIPSQLKAWLDQLPVIGKTLKTSGHCMTGLCDRHKVIIVSSRGGIFSKGSPLFEMDYQERHLETFFSFLGVRDIQFIRAEGLDMGNKIRNRAIRTAKAEIRKLAA